MEYKLLQIVDWANVYRVLAAALSNDRQKPQGSVVFVVEGPLDCPEIGLKYPGRKMFRRIPPSGRITKRFIEWANLLDFEVVPFNDCKALDTANFTFSKILEDFMNYKRNDEFWMIISTLYETNEYPDNLPQLQGINPKIFLSALRWIWISEDLNYRFAWDDPQVQCPIKYQLETRTGTSTRRGAGRAKFFAAMILIKYGFALEQVQKIIPLY